MDNNEQDGGPTLSDYLGMLRRRRWSALGVFAAAFAALAAYAFLATPVYRAGTLVFIEKVSDGVTSGGYQAPDEDYLATQSKLIVSETALRRVYEDLRLANVEEFKGGLGALRKAVSVLAVPRTRLCYVNAESADPRLAAAISNALAQNFVKRNLEHQLYMPKHVLAALQSRAKGPEARRIYESLPAVIGNPLLQQIKGQILQREVQLAELRSRYTENHPDVAGAQSQLRLMRAARERELDNVVRSVETQLSGQLRPNNVRVVDPAQPPKSPSRPRKALALALGLAGGAALGLIAAVGLDGLDQTVRTHNDVERKLGMAFLGEIPLEPPKKGQKIYTPLVAVQDTVAGEAFRDLRTMVTIANERTGDPFLLVTSTTQQEGKSFVATNLAVALSQLGRKVLIIDGDLRRPSQHHNLGCPSKPGLGELLSGQAEDPAPLIQRTDLPNLDLLSAGKRPSNASGLLNARQLPGLISWARGRYDRVIVDCPPVFPVGDVLLWGRHVRPAILVSRYGRTRMPLIQLACRRLKAGGMELVGGVLNGARPSELTYAYTRYS